MSHSKSQPKKPNKSPNTKLNKANQPKTPPNIDFREKFNKMQLQPLKTFDIPILTNIIQKFRKDIEAPIQLQTSIFNSKSLQRCLEHNNVSTLYCITDKKPLCVTCMYQNTSHKKHKVVPLNRASRQLQDEQKKDLNIIDQNITLLDTLVSRSHDNLARSEKEFPNIMNSIHEYYQELQQLLNQKRSQQILHVQQTWQKLKYEYSSLALELSRIKIFILQQVKQIKKRQGEQYLLFNRNICNNLIQVQHFVSSQICQYHQTTYYEDLKRFREFQIQIGNTLVLTSPFREKVKRENHQKSKKFLRNSSQVNNAGGMVQNIENKPNRKNSKNTKTPMVTPAKGTQNKRRSISPQPLLAHSPHRSPNLLTPIK